MQAAGPWAWVQCDGSTLSSCISLDSRTTSEGSSFLARSSLYKVKRHSCHCGRCNAASGDLSPHPPLLWSWPLHSFSMICESVTCTLHLSHGDQQSQVHFKRQAFLQRRSPLAHQTIGAEQQPLVACGEQAKQKQHTAAGATTEITSPTIFPTVGSNTTICMQGHCLCQEEWLGALGYE